MERMDAQVLEYRHFLAGNVDTITIGHVTTVDQAQAVFEGGQDHGAAAGIAAPGGIEPSGGTTELPLLSITPIPEYQADLMDVDIAHNADREGSTYWQGIEVIDLTGELQIYGSGHASSQQVQSDHSNDFSTSALDMMTGKSPPFSDRNLWMDTSAQSLPSPTAHLLQAQVSAAQGPLEEVRNHESATAEKCHACMDPLSKPIYLNCGHTFCRDCLNQLVRAGIANKASFPPRCCGGRQNGIDIDAIQNHVNEDLLLRYVSVFEEYTTLNPTYCANKHCSRPFDQIRIRKIPGKFITCIECDVQTCKECKQGREVHMGDGTFVCPRPEEMMNAEDQKLAKSKRWKQCPGRNAFLRSVTLSDVNHSPTIGHPRS